MEFAASFEQSTVSAFEVNMENTTRSTIFCSTVSAFEQSTSDLEFPHIKPNLAETYLAHNKRRKYQPKN